MDSIECYYCGCAMKIDCGNMYRWLDCPTRSCQKYTVSYYLDGYEGRTIYQSVAVAVGDLGEKYELLINMMENKAHIAKHNYTTGKSEKIIDLPSAPTSTTLDNLADKIRTYLVFS